MQPFAVAPNYGPYLFHPKGGISMKSDLASVLDARTSALKVEELAEILSVSPKTLYRKIRRRLIPSFRIGTAVRLDPRRIAEWLRTIEMGATA